MAHVIASKTGEIIRYPYSVGLLMLDNPGVTEDISEAKLALMNIYPVSFVEPPPCDIRTHKIIELDPVFENGKWVMSWEVQELTAEEIAARDNTYRNGANSTAARLLDESQKYVLEGYEKGIDLSPEFRAYRETLRNPESLEGYPINTQWPVLPENLFSENN